MKLQRARPTLLLAAGCCAAAMWGVAHAAPESATVREAETRARATVARMTTAERTVLTHGIMAVPGAGADVPPDAVPGAGYVAGIERLGIPALRETDASLGVAWSNGIRKDGATALPSGLAIASGWDPELAHRAGAMIGAEARAKGFNVMLAGGVNLARDPRNGRNFEYLGEDPWLAGVLAGASISGIQSNNIIATIKHFALNGQETGRKFVDAEISESAARESDLLAFQIGIERGRPGAVMCAYNLVNSRPACANEWLLTKVLKHDWKYPGFVMSDWGAVPGVQAAAAGLDQQSGSQLDSETFFAKPLADEATRNPAMAQRLTEMNVRILTSIYAHRLDSDPAQSGGTIDFAAHVGLAEQVAKNGIVLLRNERDALPLAGTVRRIAVIGGYADTGVLSGGGSSQVHGQEGPAVVRPLGGSGQFTGFLSQHYHRSVPLDAIKAAAPDAKVVFRDGRYITDAVLQAKLADVAIVFAHQWMGEGIDAPDLSLPDGQDALIAAIADANPNTIVVLQTGGPVLMPWLEKTAAVLEAWYPGARGGEAIASILFGKTNPSGRLPMTFPTSLEQLPRPKLDGSDVLDPDFLGRPPTPDAKLAANYAVEGSDVGYRWNARKGYKALFPFGFGLSYTSFRVSGLAIRGTRATFTVTNSGKRDGSTVAQLYLRSRNGEPKQRLVGFERVDLAAGASRTASLTIDPRLLADWSEGGWVIDRGDYAFALGENAETLGPSVIVRMQRRRWND